MDNRRLLSGSRRTGRDRTRQIHRLTRKRYAHRLTKPLCDELAHALDTANG